MRISEWSSDVCSSDVGGAFLAFGDGHRGRGDRDVVAAGGRGAVAGGDVERDAAFPGRFAQAKDEVERGVAAVAFGQATVRSEEHRVGKECVSNGRSRWSP